MSDRAAKSTSLTVEMMRLATNFYKKGAVDFIKKPFPTADRTLDRVIKKTLGIPLPPKSAAAKSRWHAREGSGEGPDDGGWLTVTEAARLLEKDLPWLDLKKARSRVSVAAGRGEFQTNGESRKQRRIEPHSFDSWRLKQRDRDLDSEDDEA